MNNSQYTQQASAECKVCSTVDRSSRSRHATSGSMAPSSTSTPPTSPDRTPKHQTEAAGISVPTPAATEVEAARLQCGSCCVCDELWVCMVCGLLGCGRLRYGEDPNAAGGNKGHALEHWVETNQQHRFSMQLGTQRIWASGRNQLIGFHRESARGH